MLQCRNRPPLRSGCDEADRLICRNLPRTQRPMQSWDWLEDDTTKVLQYQIGRWTAFNEVLPSDVMVLHFGHFKSCAAE